MRFMVRLCGSTPPLFVVQANGPTGSASRFSVTVDASLLVRMASAPLASMCITGVLRDRTFFLWSQATPVVEVEKETESDGDNIMFARFLGGSRGSFSEAKSPQQ